MAALSVAVQDPAVEAALRGAFRASPYAQHRLSMSSFLEAPEGRGLGEKLAQALKAPPSAVALTVDPQRAFDLVVLRRVDRLTWRGGGRIAVAWMPSRHSWESARAYVGGKRMRAPTFGALLELSDVIIAVQPARPKARRVDPQPGGPGDVIQDPSDGELAIGRLRRSPSGDVVVQSLGDCDGIVDCGGDGGGGGSGAIQLTQFCVNFGDDPFGAFDVEIQFRAYRNGAFIGDVYFGGVPAGSYASPSCITANTKYVFWEPSAPGQSFSVDMWELDTWPLSDDFKGTATWSFGESGQARTYWSGPGTISGAASHSW